VVTKTVNLAEIRHPEIALNLLLDQPGESPVVLKVSRQR
jgi:hypothetical protein